MIPVLLITYNRLAFTKKALGSLIRAGFTDIWIIDNGSTDETKPFLTGIKKMKVANVIFNETNEGISGAFNNFLSITKEAEFIVKCDNDTVLPPDFIDKMLPHMEFADIVQAKHNLIKASGVGTFDQWVKTMPAQGDLRYNSFVGGSGIMCRRSVLSNLPTRTDKLMSWRIWQRDNPRVKKAFCVDCEIELLDTDSNGANYPEEYREYYVKTGRI